MRRAIGARRRDVIRQFLMDLAGRCTIAPTPSIAAFLVSVAIGLIFGLYPAVRAAGLDPVNALHYE